MRAIDATLKARIQRAQQTLYNNAEPKMDVTVTRYRTPITRAGFWHESIVTAGATAISTSVAVRRMVDKPTRAYVAYVTDAGTLVIKYAELNTVYSQLIWITHETIEGCSACALDFDGSFVTADYGKVEYLTDDLPYLFYINSSGSLWYKKLGEEAASLLGSNVDSVDVIRGVASAQKDIDQGLTVFYIVDGMVYYNQLVAGAWLGQELVSIAPANAVTLKVERTFDWRIVLQVTDSAGALYEVFSKMYASGWNGLEYLTAAIINPTVVVTEIFYPEAQLADDYVTAGAEATAISFGDVMPVLRDAWNYDDGAGDYGKFILARWADAVAGIETNLAAFKIVDAYNISYYPSAIYETGYPNRLILEFADFNNATNPISVVYTPGSLVWLDGALVSGSSVDFNATGLVPTYIPAPVVTNIASVDNRTIRITFDRPIISIDPGIGLSVTGFEPFTSPGGSLIPTTYGIESITAFDDYTVQVYLTYAGRLKHPQGEVTILYTNGLTGPGPTAVAGFSQGFTPAGLTLWFKPNDPETITMAPLATLTCFDVTYKFGKNGDEYITAAGYAATLVVTNVGGLPL